MHGVAEPCYLVPMDPRSKPVPADWAPSIDRWCSVMRASGLSPQTVYLRRSHIAQMARALKVSPDEVTVDQMLEWLGRHDWSRETRRARRSSLRLFFTYLGRPDVAAGFPRVKPSVPMPRPIPEPALRSALADADDRQRLILRLAAEVGMRRAEIAGVHATDVTRSRDGYELLVHGKGGKQRLVPISDSLAATVLLRAGGNWLFGGDVGGHISPAWVGKLATRALPSPWTLHKLRHRFATIVNDEVGDLVVVQQLLGHASLATTQLYVRANRARMRVAVSAAVAA